MVQIPAALEKLCGKGLELEHAFGRCVCGCGLTERAASCGCLMAVPPTTQPEPTHRPPPPPGSTRS
jgi:hypothetical protein